MLLTRSLLLGSLLFLALGASQASAVSITLSDCDAGGCQGSTLFLDVVDQGGSYDVTLTLNSDNYTGSRSGLNQVGFLAVKGWTSVSATSDPGGTWGTAVEANVSSSGICANGSTTDKVCLPGYTDITSGGDYTWTFTITGGTLLDTSSWHIGGQYADDALSANGQIISTGPGGGGLIPEPSGALLFGLGTLFVVRRTATRR